MVVLAVCLGQFYGTRAIVTPCALSFHYTRCLGLRTVGFASPFEETFAYHRFWLRGAQFVHLLSNLPTTVLVRYSWWHTQVARFNKLFKFIRPLNGLHRDLWTHLILRPWLFLICFCVLYLCNCSTWESARWKISTRNIWRDQ